MPGLTDDDHRNRRRAIFCLIVVAILAVGGVAGYHVYRQVKHHVFLERAKEHLAKGENEKALFQVQVVLQQYPDDKEALRALIQVAEKMQAPWVLAAKKRLYEASPGDTAIALDFAEEACRRDQPRLAAEVAERLLDKPETAAAAQNILAMAALQEGNRAAALTHFQKAYELKPSSPAIVKNYAAFLLSDPEKDHTSTIKSLIDALADDPSSVLTRKRLQLGLELKNNHPREALSIAEEILKHPEHVFADELQLVSLLAIQNTAKAEAALDVLCAKETLSDEQSLELLHWIVRNRHHKRALAFIEKLPANLRKLPNVRVDEIECLLQLGEVDTAKERLEKANWEETDFLRLAYLANLLQTQGDTQAAAETRKAAVAAAMKAPADQPGPILAPMLINFIAANPDWDAEREDMLWAMADSPRLQEDALRTLFRLYRLKKNALGLTRVSLRLSTEYPDDRKYLNNAISLALLTKMNRQWAVDGARELFEKHPEDPFVRSTYAYSLALEDQPQKALEVIQEVDAKLLQTPEFALYHGYILAANGQFEEAREAWKNVDPDKLLDAEQLLLK